MKQHFFYIASIFSGLAMAQIHQGETNVNRDTDFKNESVVVERVYEPKVEAAEKIKQTPDISESKSTKLPVTYGLKDVEAESDFETSTIHADELPVRDQVPYNNYIRAGLGNRYTFLADGYAAFPLDNNKDVGVSLDYYSSAGDIPEVSVDTDELKMNAEGFLKMNFDKSKADLRLGGGIHQLNYYGFNDSFRDVKDLKADDQSYKNIYVAGRYDAFNHLFLDNVQIKAGFFTDKYDATESSFDAKSSFKNLNLFDPHWMNDLQIGAKADVNLNVTNTDFETISKDSYRFLNVGINPKLAVSNELLQLDLGANVQYLNADSFKDTNKIYVFPTLSISLDAIPAFGVYGGMTGGLIQNKYETLYQQNPYLLTNQHLEYTRNQLEVFAGIRGDIGQNFKYDASATFQDLKNIPFFYKGSNFYDSSAQQNAFSTIYDDGRKTTIEGRLNYTGVSNLNLGSSLRFQTYQLDHLDKAFDRPSIQASLDADYKLLNDKLILGANLFFVGKRKALQDDGPIINVTNLPTYSIYNLDPYVDLNLNAQYMLMQRWSAFIEIRNVLNKNYERFLDYEVQGITGIGGVMFKF